MQHGALGLFEGRLIGQRPTPPLGGGVIVFLHHTLDVTRARRANGDLNAIVLGEGRELGVDVPPETL